MEVVSGVLGVLFLYSVVAVVVGTVISKLFYEDSGMLCSVCGVFWPVSPAIILLFVVSKITGRVMDNLFD